MELLLFDRVGAARPNRSIELDPGVHRTYHYWHAFVPGVKAGQLYGYRVHGPSDPERGMRFDGSKVLLDPYGRGVVVPPKYSRSAAAQPGDNAATARKSVVADPSAYDWEGDEPLRRPSARTIIYEMHVRGFTCHPSSGVAAARRGSYANYSGTGNTINTNHPVVRRLIVDSLRYWVQEMHVDGFRFDLASILAHDAQGHVLPNPPVLWDIESDPVLAGTKLIAEAWDAAGLYLVGSFVGDSWKEWNGRFRDDVRDFFRGADGSLKRFADRFLGSPEIYGHKEREPEQSINFVTCHDGFTLNDLVSYNDKHNEANGEEHRDGANDNRSWNCGVEGPSNDPVVEQLRNRQVKNFLAANLLALGVPMILMGEEIRRSQGGNNNAYCQDNEISWFDWTRQKQHPDVHRFLKLLLARRLLRATEHERERKSLTRLIDEANKTWHGVRLNQPDWSDHSRSVAFTAEIRKEKLWLHLIFNAHCEPLDFELPPPNPGNGNPWRRWIDTALKTPQDIAAWEQAPAVPGLSYRAEARWVVALYTPAG